MLWLNPVVLSLYNHNDLEQVIRSKGFTSVSCTENHIEIVRKKYQQIIQSSKRPVADMRCPRAVQYIKEQYNPDFVFPSISPILIHCATELYQRYQAEDALLYITTPCESLKELGNSLKFKNTVFQTWNEFAAENNITLKRNSLEASPIPPGFYDACSNKVCQLVSKSQIDSYFSEEKKEDYEIYELLYCQQGCHNGDGILENEDEMA